MAMQAHITSRFGDEISSYENGDAGSFVHLSTMLKDPTLRAIFRRAERDNDGAFAVPTQKNPRLNGGAVVKPSRDLVLA